MNKKMNSKQPVKGGLSLDEFVMGADPVSNSTPEPQKRPVVASKPKNVPIKPKDSYKGVGRPSVPSDELKTRNLQIKLTEAEFEAKKKEAGRIPLAVYVRDEMKEKGII